MRDKRERNRTSRNANCDYGDEGEVRTTHDPLYGDIPMIGRTIVTPSGEKFLIFDYDPEFEPELPAGAIRGNVRNQEFCSACHRPKYFYVDQERACVQCNSTFVFGAREQKHWYEVLKFNFNSVAIRCIQCRRKRRDEKTLREQIATAKATLKELPGDTSALLDLAEAIVTYRRLTGHGDLDLAIASARRARQLWPEASSALYWEAGSHVEAGRRESAAKAFREFLAMAPQGRNYRAMAREARKFLKSWDAV